VFLCIIISTLLMIIFFKYVQLGLPINNVMTLRWQRIIVAYTQFYDFGTRYHIILLKLFVYPFIPPSAVLLDVTNTAIVYERRIRKENFSIYMKCPAESFLRLGCCRPFTRRAPSTWKRDVRANGWWRQR